MLTKRFDNTIAVRFDRGEEIVAGLRRVCEEYDVTAAAVTGLGAAKGTTVGMYDIPTRQYSEKVLPQFLEITNLTGNVSVKDGEVYLHLHITLADENAHAFGGHLKAATVGATAELFVTVYDTEVSRVQDDATGLNLWNW